jgi:hypothetical protein
MSRKPIIAIFGFSFLVSLVLGVYLTFSQNKQAQLALSQAPQKPQILGMSGGGGGGSRRPPQMYVYGGDNYSGGTGGIISMASTDEPTLTLSTYNLSGSAEITVYRANIDSALKYLVHDSENKQLNTNQDTSSFELIGTSVHNITQSDNGNIIPLPIDGKGIWYVTIKIQNITVTGFIIRSDNGVIAKEGNDKFIFWGQNFSTYKSVTGGNLTLYNLKDSVSQLRSTSLDNKGVGEAEMSVDTDIAIYQNGDDISLLPINLQYLGMGYGYSQFAKSVIQSRYFIFTDRPIYQPGDTVNFKAIIRTDDDARYSVPEGSAKITIETGNNESKFEKSYPISEDGSINGKFELPNDVSVGSYSLFVDKRDESKSYNWGEYSSNSLSFDVQNYQKPESFISVDTPSIEYISGDKAKVTISGSYFSGQPLIATDIKYKVTAVDYFEYTYFTDQEQSQKLSLYTFYGLWYGSQTVAEGTVTLDKTGTAQLEIDTKQLDIPDEKYSYTKGKSKVFVVEVTQEDGSLVPSFSKKNFIVYAGDYGIYQSNRSSSGVIKQSYKLPIKLSSYFKTTALSNVPLTGKIHRETWVKDDVQTSKYPTYHMEEEDLGDVNMKTGKDGTTSLSFTPVKSGVYKIVVEGYDESDNYIAKEFYVYISDHEMPIYRGSDSPQISLTLDQDKYDPGSTAKLTIVSAIADRDVFLTLERGRVDRSQVVHITGKSTIVDLPLQASDVPNMYVTVSSFNNFGLDQAEINLPVVSSDKKLIVTIKPDSAKYGPGDNVKVDLTTSDLDGMPQSAEVALWAVDKAIFELADTNLFNIFDTFWSERSDTTTESHSLMGILTQQAEGGGGGDGGRSIFKDTAYWNPSIKTGSDGKASVKFKLPDNLTTWTMAAVAATRDSRVGQATKEITVTKDLIVRPILPNIMRVGDEIYISALVQNFTDKAHEFQVQLSFDSGKVDQNTWEKVQIGSMAMEQLEWKISPDKVIDAAKLKIVATSTDHPGLSDSIESTIPVRRFGFLEKVGETAIGDKNYSLKFDEQIDREQSSVKLSLAPSLFGTLPTVMNYLVSYGYGCTEQTVSRLVPSLLVAENPSLFGSAIKDKDLDKVVDKAIARLRTMQRGDGGWTWWYTGKSDPHITNYVVENLTKAEKLGYKIPNNMLSNATRYLQNNIQDLSSSDPDLLAISIIKNRDPKDLKKLISLAVSQGDTLYWEAGPKARFGSIEASTGLALQAILLAGGDKEIADKAVLYLTRSRKSDYWGNTYGTSRVISALIEYAKLSRDLTPNYVYKITQDGKELSTGKVTDAKTMIADTVIEISKLKDNSEIAISQTGEGNLYSTLLTSQFLTSPNQKAINRGISITKRFENSKGSELEIGVGDTVNVLLTVSGLSSDDKYGVMTDELPSGMVPVNTSLKNEQNSWNSPEDYETGFNITDTDVTENGVILSLYNVSSQERTYSYKARVVSAGKFAVPPATVALMYSPEIYGRSSTSQIELKKGSGATSGDLINKFIIPWKIVVIAILVVVLVVVAIIIIKKRKSKPQPLPTNET